MVDLADPNVTNGGLWAIIGGIAYAVFRGGAAKLEAAAAVQKQIAESMARLTLLEKKCMDLEAGQVRKDAELTDLRRQVAELKAIPPCIPGKCSELAAREAKIKVLEDKIKDWEARHPQAHAREAS